MYLLKICNNAYTYTVLYWMLVCSMYVLALNVFSCTSRNMALLGKVLRHVGNATIHRFVLRGCILTCQVRNTFNIYKDIYVHSYDTYTLHVTIITYNTPKGDKLVSHTIRHVIE